MDNKNERLTWRLSEIERKTGLKYAFLYEQIKQGNLKATKIGRVIVVADAELRRFLGLTEAV